MNSEDYFNKRPESYPKAGYDPRILKYYELLEENEALKKKVSSLQSEIDLRDQRILNLEQDLEPNPIYDPFYMREQGW